MESIDKIEIIHEDITKLNVEAIVNAANPSLMGGGGVDGAIHKAAGPALKEACRPLRGCHTGDAKITPGFNLQAKYVIHTVGPVWNNDTQGETILLTSAYRRSIEVAVEHQVKNIAFPSISTGAYRFPFDQACKIAVQTILSSLQEHRSIEKIYLVMFSEKDFKGMERIFRSFKP